MLEWGILALICGPLEHAVAAEEDFPSIVTAKVGEPVVLNPGQFIVSPSHTYSMSLQPDCRLAVFAVSDTTTATETWSSDSAVENDGCFLALGYDGNLAVHRLRKDGVSDVVWQTGPDRYTPSGSHFLALQDNGDLVVYSGTPTQVRSKMWSATSGVIKQREMGFRLIGGAAGFAFFAAINDLANNAEIPLIPVRVEKGDGPVRAIQRAYRLAGWMTVPAIGKALCKVANPHVCVEQGGQQRWWLTPSEVEIPVGACKRIHGIVRAAPSNFICVPDVEVGAPSTLFETRRFTPKDAPGIPEVVTQNTRGCEKFDRRCQLQILTRNTRQSDAWSSAFASGFLTSDKTNDDMHPWWAYLSGTVTLPAISFDVIVNTNDPALSEFAKCSDIRQAVKAADLEIRRSGSAGLRPGSDPTTVITADCNLINTASDLPSRAQSFGGPMQIPASRGIALEQEWRTRMHWSDLTAKMKGADGGGMIVGVWDGSVAEDRSTFIRDKTTYFQFKANKGADAGGNIFTEGNVISWIDSFPKGLDPPAAGPCGAYVDYAVKSHATVIAGMMSGIREGVTKNSRLWVHVWGSNRIEGNVGPANSLAWFIKNVADGDKIFEIIYAPYVANLSCDASDESHVQALKREVAGVSHEGQSQDVAPYVVSVAAGNREDGSSTFFVNAGTKPDGYAALSHDPATSGFISVVALGPTGDDVLRCHDIRDLVRAELSSDNPLIRKPITDLCPAANSHDTSRDLEPLVKFGPAFDVAAVGLGVGPALDSDDAIVMWGSSFAAPRVATLALQILSKTHLDQVLQQRVPASAVADRIRFTTDKLDGSVALYGVINAERALGFEHDIVEMVLPEDAESQSWDQSLEKPWVATCLHNSGVVQIHRSDQHKYNYPLEGKTMDTLNLADIFRLRRDPKVPGIFEAMLTSGKDPPATPIRRVDLKGHMVPLECSLPTGSKVKLRQPNIPMPSNYIRSVTRCSFVGQDCG